MTGRYGELNYPKLTKQGMVLGLILFVVGEIGVYAASVGWVVVPGWESALLLDTAVIGVLLLLLSPFVFGIFLPLTE
ncbi:hypothetical protein [Salinigranum marinum]|uniref:DUF7860 family protein n=1 Tax=Salinigranum marinum TaxID=1515595 RepID=UPI002989FC27|nr:hypothetical protein [Salinigranum marinum]